MLQFLSVEYEDTSTLAIEGGFQVAINVIVSLLLCKGNNLKLVGRDSLSINKDTRYGY